MAEEIKVNICPACGQERDNIKLYELESVIFLGGGMISKSIRVAGCRDCVRPMLTKHIWKQLLPSNILWPFLVLPTFIYRYRDSGKPGHSPKWVELVHSLNAQAVLEEQDKAEREKLQIASSYINRHPGGTVYQCTGGGFGSKTLLLAAAWAVIGIPLLSFAYAAAEFYCPEMTFKVCVIPLLFVALHGYVLWLIAKHGNCRDELGLRFVAILLGAWSFYLSWIFWIFIVSGYQMLTADPAAIWRTIVYLAQEQFWQGDHGPKSTLEHTIVWSLEAIIFIAVPAGVVWNYVRKHPFCESCLKKLETFAVMRQRELPQNMSEFKSKLRMGDLSELAALPPRQSSKYLAAEIKQCPDCKNDFVLLLTSCADMAHYNNVHTTKHWVIPPLYCDPQEINKIIK